MACSSLPPQHLTAKLCYLSAVSGHPLSTEHVYRVQQNKFKTKHWQDLKNTRTGKKGKADGASFRVFVLRSSLEGNFKKNPKAIL